MVEMPYKFKRDCPVCGKPELLSLSDHLRQVHRLIKEPRKKSMAKSSSIFGV